MGIEEAFPEVEEYVKLPLGINYVFSLVFFIVGLFFLYGFYQGAFKRRLNVLYGLKGKTIWIAGEGFRYKQSYKEVEGKSAVVYGIISGVLSIVLFLLAYLSFTGKILIFSL